MLGNSVSNAMLEKSMQALWQRQQAIVNNIVNEETPGYKAKHVEFESLLKKEISARTNVTAFNSAATIDQINRVQPRTVVDTTTSSRADGNNVNANSEQIELARAQIQWDAVIQKMSGFYSTLQYAIKGGR